MNGRGCGELMQALPAEMVSVFCLSLVPLLYFVPAGLLLVFCAFFLYSPCIIYLKASLHTSIYRPNDLSERFIFAVFRAPIKVCLAVCVCMNERSR